MARLSHCPGAPVHPFMDSSDVLILLINRFHLIFDAKRYALETTLLLNGTSMTSTIRTWLETIDGKLQLSADNCGSHKAYKVNNNTFCFAVHAFCTDTHCFICCMNLTNKKFSALQLYERKSDT